MNRKINFPYWFLIILLAAFAAGYWAWTESLNDESSIMNYDSLSTRHPSGDSLETTGELAGWQTYRNEEYGFEFRYPNSWIEGTKLTEDTLLRILPVDDEKTDALGPSVFTRVSENPQDLPLQQFLTISPKYISKSEVEEIKKKVKSGEFAFGVNYQDRKIKVDNNDALEIYYDGEGGSERVVFIPRNKKVYEVGLGSDFHFLKYSISEGKYMFSEDAPKFLREPWDIFDQILSTLRFTPTP